ncbi:hypothetical protein J1N35_021898 [Gossypium stocksii]|uniref:Uncharacterized protein n=1 Tax=Gossypium stocksii TaxID=47602 RepID=A0A9D3VH47_9ROSI|nr:hypothetical protein J1N35_021898 [Gossypium stocksii]
MEKVEHDVSKLEDEKEFGVEDHDKLVRNEGVFTSIDIGLGVVLDVGEELNRELCEGV